MGVDVEMKARLNEPMADDELAALDVALREHLGEEYRTERTVYPGLDRDRYDPNVINVRTLHRFYGPGYERGNWPTIRKLGDWLAVRLGERAQLRYGSDAGDTEWEALIPWAEARAENDPWWDEHGNEPYEAFFRWGD